MSLKHRPRALLLGAIAVITSAVAPSCGGSTVGSRGTDGATHWLDHCEDDDDCEGLECVCGVCTRRCEAATDCQDLDGAAVCSVPESCASPVDDVVCALPAGAGGGTAGEAGAGGSGAASTGGATTGGAAIGGAMTSGSTGSGSVTSLDPDQVCAGIEFAAETIPVDVYLMLDKSSSMAELLPGSEVSKWDATIAGIQTFVNTPAATGVGVGIQYFAQPDACDVGAYATPAVAVAPLPDVADAIIDSTNAEAPETLTPTAPALEGALQYMQGYAASDPSRPSAVVLVTDGFPTECGVSCSSDADCAEADAQCVNGMCDPDSIGAIAAVAERYAKADPPVQTFVIGINQGLDNLDVIAEAGGTRNANLIDGDDVEAAALDALFGTVSTPLPCDYEIPGPSTGEAIDPDRVLFTYASLSGVEETVQRVSDQAGCASGAGWFYDDNDAPMKISVCPETCGRFGSGRVMIEFACASR